MANKKKHAYRRASISVINLGWGDGSKSESYLAKKISGSAIQDIRGLHEDT